MAEISKGRSPFYPGQPVPVELFAGRKPQLEWIMTRGVGQVAQGKPMAIFVQGEYGIGKTSFAELSQSLAEKQSGLHGIYASLGACQTVNDVAEAVLKATVHSGAFDPRRAERIRNWLAKYIGDQALFGFNINLATLKQDAPNLSSPFDMLSFLGEVSGRLKETGITGVFLVLDEINGIASNPHFAHFLKGLVDTNAVSRQPLPLLLMLCGVAERRGELIRSHQPVERIFDLIEISPMTDKEMEEFFVRAFAAVQMTVEPAAMNYFTHYSAGFPKIMHMIGDAAYWLDKDGSVDATDAVNAVLVAAGEVGRKYVDQQVYSVISKDYQSILAKLASAKQGEAFGAPIHKTEAAKVLTEVERRKFNNFLVRMQKLRVIRHGESRGEYVFSNRMVQLYIWLESVRRNPEALEFLDSQLKGPRHISLGP